MKMTFGAAAVGEGLKKDKVRAYVSVHFDPFHSG